MFIYPLLLNRKNIGFTFEILVKPLTVTTTVESFFYQIS